MSPRLSAHDLNKLSPRQREIHNDILSRRGRVGGPFPVWLRNPELAECAQKLGAYCRYDTCLPPILSELAILVVAGYWDAPVEWGIHAPIARRVGLPEQVILDIEEGRPPHLEDSKARAVYDYTKELLASGRVGDALHARAVSELSESGVIDLVALIGYYSLVAFTLNAFEMPMPEEKLGSVSG